MKKLIKIFFLGVAGFVLLILIGLVIAYFSLGGNYNPPKTVTDDVNLTQIEFNDISFHCETYGTDTNEVIIVLHGGPGGDYKSLLSLKELSDNYKIVFFDQRGSGLTERVSPNQLTTDELVEDLDHFVNHFGQNSKVNLIGHSWGSMLATAYISKYPEKINNVVLAASGGLTSEMLKKFMEDTGLDEPQPTFDMIMHMLSSWLKSLHVDGPDEYAEEDFFIYNFIMTYEEKDHPLAKYYCNLELPDAAKDMWRFGALASKHIPQSALDAEGNYDLNWEKGLRNFEGKALFMTGECDKLLSKEFQKQQMVIYKNSELIEVAGCGHMLIGEQPDACISIIRDFFEND